MAEKYIYATAAADPGAKAKGKESRGFRDTRSREKAAMENNRFERLRPMLDNLPAQWFSYAYDYFYIYENHSYEDYTVLKKIRITDKNRSAIIKLREAFENGIYRNAGSIDSLLDVFRRGNGRHNRHNIGFGETGTGRRNDGVAVRKPNGDDFRYPRENSRFDKGLTGDTSAETEADSDGSAFSDGKGSRDIASLENLHEINAELRAKVKQLEKQLRAQKAQSEELRGQLRRTVRKSVRASARGVLS